MCRPQGSAYNRRMHGNVGTAMLPGSQLVLDRDTMQLVPCTKEMCSDSMVRDGVTIPINRAPYTPTSGVYYGINPHSDPEYQKAAWSIVQTSLTRTVQDMVGGVGYGRYPEPLALCHS